MLTCEPKQTFTLVGIFGYSGGRDTPRRRARGRVHRAGRAAADARRDRRVQRRSTSRPPAGVADATLRDRRRGRARRPATSVKTGERARRGRRRPASRRACSFFNNILLGFAGVALFVGIFLILNTFSIIVAQRTRELALMRAIGASRRQMIGSVLVEAVVDRPGRLGARARRRHRGRRAAGVRCSATFGGGGLELAGLGVPPAAVIAAFAVGLVVTVRRRAAAGAARVADPAGRGDAGGGDPGPAADPDHRRRRGGHRGRRRRCSALGLAGKRRRDAVADPRRRAGRVHRRGAADPADQPAGGRRCSAGCSPGRCRASWAGSTRAATRAAPRSPRPR